MAQQRRATARKLKRKADAKAKAKAAVATNIQAKATAKAATRTTNHEGGSAIVNLIKTAVAASDRSRGAALAAVARNPC